MTIFFHKFQSVQRLAATKEKEMVRKAKANADVGLFGDKKQETLIELQDNRTQRQIQQQQLQEEQNLRMLEEHEASIRQLEVRYATIINAIPRLILTVFLFQSDISDVNQIFKELGALVHEQGEMIDSIEGSVERTEVFVSEGAQQLREASTYQTKLRKKKCVLIVIAAVVLSILIGIIVWQTSK